MSPYRIDVIAGADEGDEFHLRPGHSDAANSPPLARCRVRRSAGQLPRFWYYVGQLAFAATQLSHHRRDRMLVLTNDDVPGVIGRIGTLCGFHGINIVGMQLGRKAPGGRAVSILNLDGAVPDAVLGELRALPHIRDATLVRL